MNSTKIGLKNNYEEIHWWQFPLNDFSIKLNNNFKNELFNRIYTERSRSLDFASYINKVSKKYNKNWNFKRQRLLLWEYKNHTKFIPAWFVYEAALYLGINPSLVEKNIIAYITFRGKNEIYKPILPVKITPEFTAILIHAMCDGCLTPNENFCYAQKDKDNITRFINILKNIFGDYIVVDSKRKDGTPTTYTPKIFAKIISHHYGIRTFLSFKCRIPYKIKFYNKLHNLAVLSTFLIDEGHTASSICFSSSNKKLLKDLIFIAGSLGYKCNSLVTYYPTDKNKLTDKHYKFALSASSLEKFYLDLKYLFEKYPYLYIGKKFENIEKSIKIKNRDRIQKRKGETKQTILNSLKDGNKTAYELRDLANISIWTTYHHLQQLTKKGIVIKYLAYSKTYLYKLV